MFKCIRSLQKGIGSISIVGRLYMLTSHSCRHTYISQLQGLGVDMETIKRIVGHADIDMTEHYLHVQEPIRKDAVTRFSDTFVDFEEE